MNDIPDKQSIHQIQAVHKACKSIQMEISFTQEQVDCIERYFHFLYGIGQYQGTRQTKKRKRVVSVDKDGKFIRTFESALETAGVLGVDKRTIGKACRGDFKCKGLILVWEEDFLKIST